MKLLPLTQEILTSTTDKWHSQLNFAGDDLTPVRYFRMLDSAEIHLQGDRDNYMIYALCDDGDPAAKAFINITHAHPGHNESWLKILDIIAEPVLDYNYRETNEITYISKTNGICKLTASILTETLQLSDTKHKAKQIKLYGGSQIDKSMLFIVIDTLKALGFEKLGFEISQHSNWLVLTKQI